MKDKNLWNVCDKSLHVAMHSKDNCEMHWSLRLPYIINRGRPISEVLIALFEQSKRELKLYKRRVRLYRLKKKLRVP